MTLSKFHILGIPLGNIPLVVLGLRYSLPLHKAKRRNKKNNSFYRKLKTCSDVCKT